MFGRCVLIIRNFLCLIFLTYASVSFSAQNATVKNDGAMVYRKADFDSPVIGYFRRGQKVQVSSKKFAEAFYRVRFRQGVLGYIADSDIEGAADKSKSKQVEAEEKPRKERNRPKIIQAKYLIGPALGYVRYAEILNRQEFRDNLIMFGAKASLPVETFYLDFNFYMTTQAPKFLKDLSTKAPSGYVILSSVLMQYPLFDFSGCRGIVFFGGGPSFAYSSFLIDYNGSAIDTSEARVGGVFNIGVAFDLGGAVLKFDPKFYVEKASYNSFDAAIQIEL